MLINGMKMNHQVIQIQHYKMLKINGIHQVQKVQINKKNNKIIGMKAKLVQIHKHKIYKHYNFQFINHNLKIILNLI